MVIGVPFMSMRRRAVTARLRVAAARRRAAVIRWWELSARNGGLRAGVEFADHAVQVSEDLLVHLDQAGVPFAGGDVDEGERAVPLLAQFGEELRTGQEDGAGQAGVGVRAALLHW